MLARGAVVAREPLKLRRPRFDSERAYQSSLAFSLVRTYLTRMPKIIYDNGLPKTRAFFGETLPPLTPPESMNAMALWQTGHCEECGLPIHEWSFQPVGPLPTKGEHHPWCKP